jgi:uncharacterized protein
MSSELHETRDALSAELLDVKRAVDSMKEELEAIDWYAQRAAATSDPLLREILEHHRREEIEHFVMLLEWLRRRSPEFDAQLAVTLFKSGAITEAAKETEAPANVAGTHTEKTTIGSLIGKPAPGANGG